MKRVLVISLSAILAFSTAPKASADAGILLDIWGLSKKLFGDTVKADGAVNFGPLDHNAYWSFCSSNGYRSYYNRDGYIICSYKEFNRHETEPQGDVYYYGKICNHRFGNNADYKDDGTCESQSYNN